jgi:hypothetical protein
MKRLADQIKQALSALAQADAGEVSGRYRMEAALNPSPLNSSSAPAADAPATSTRKLVALGVGATLPAPVMEYVIGVCRRMRADLLLLTTDPAGLRALLAEHLPALNGIGCEAEELGTANRRAVLRVLQRRSSVLFAVSGTADDPVRSLVRGRRGLFDNTTPVPVVVVGEQAATEKSHAGVASPRRAEPFCPTPVSQP